MKQFTCSLLVFIAITLCPPGMAGQQGPVRFSADPWPPFTYGKTDAPPTGGLSVELAKAIFTRLDREVSIRLFPWKRCLRQMETGDRDAILTLGYDENRLSYLAYTDSIFHVRDLLYTRVDEAPVRWKTFAELKHLTFGRAAGFLYGKEFEDAVAEHAIAIQTAPTDEHCFRMLAASRIDAFICNEFSAREILRVNPELQGRFQASENVIHAGPLYMAFSLRSTEHTLIPQINEILTQMKKHGEIERIIQAFFNRS